jgi:hypothetical protein
MFIYCYYCFWLYNSVLHKPFCTYSKMKMNSLFSSYLSSVLFCSSFLFFFTKPLYILSYNSFLYLMFFHIPFVFLSCSLSYYIYDSVFLFFHQPWHSTCILILFLIDLLICSPQYSLIAYSFILVLSQILSFSFLAFSYYSLVAEIVLYLPSEFKNR